MYNLNVSHRRAAISTCIIFEFLNLCPEGWDRLENIIRRSGQDLKRLDNTVFFFDGRKPKEKLKLRRSWDVVDANYLASFS